MSVHFHTIVVKISYKKSYKELDNKDTIKWERFGNPFSGFFWSFSKNVKLLSHCF
jgi:hypothetical protein